MSQLAYQPAFDPFHAVFRSLRLRGITEKLGPLYKEQMRILDFYLLFPFRIKAMRLARAQRRYKKLSEKYAYLTPYGEQPDPSLLFARMKPMQIAALDTLASKALIDSHAYNEDKIKATSRQIPDAIAVRARELNEREADLIEFLEVLAADYELLGPDGLKARSGLMEFRYDAL